MKKTLSVATLTLPLTLLLSISTHLCAENAQTPVEQGHFPTANADKPVQAPTTNNPSLTIPTQAQQPSANKTTAAYLGMGVDLLPQSVVAQMPAGVSTGEGILITRFADDSPSKKSGLRAYDILLSYDNNKLVHPKQFIDLVHKDQPGRQVTLKVLRNGKVTDHLVTLGSQVIPQIPDGLTIKAIDKSHFIASIRFKDARGQQQLREYKGTREQIYMQALNARDLPQKEKQQILYSAGGTKNNKSNGWGSFMPFGNNKNGSSFFPFGNKNNGNSNNSWGSFFPFNR